MDPLGISVWKAGGSTLHLEILLRTEVLIC